MRILAAIVALAFAGHSAFALSLEDLKGKWVGDRISKSNGKTEVQPTVYIFKKTPAGLVERASTELSSGIIKNHGKYLYDKSNGVVDKTEGSASFFTTKGGKVVTVASGYWNFRNDTFRIRLYSESDNRSSTTKFHLLNKNVLIVAIQTSTGSITGRFFRQ